MHDDNVANKFNNKRGFHLIQIQFAVIYWPPLMDVENETDRTPKGNRSLKFWWWCWLTIVIIVPLKMCWATTQHSEMTLTNVGSTVTVELAYVQKSIGENANNSLYEMLIWSSKLYDCCYLCEFFLKFIILHQVNRTKVQ